MSTVTAPGYFLSGALYMMIMALQNNRRIRLTAVVFLISMAWSLVAQPGGGRRGGDDNFTPDFGFGPGGPGGPPGGVQEEYQLLGKFDKDKNKRLDAGERKAAREFLAQEKAAGRGPRQMGPPGGMRRNQNTSAPGEGKKLSLKEVKNQGNAPLYDPHVLRTLFFEFESADWEKELEDFHNTDVEVPAKLTVDGKEYPEVGIHFRGASSYFTVGTGYKRSLNVAVDFAHEEQRLLGFRTLNLLNAHTDPSYLRSVLYLSVARDYLAAPRANLVQVVINGESWGIYVNVEQFNKDFVKTAFGSTKGARWKVPGSPRGKGGLEYLGDQVEEYKKIYELKSKDEAASWDALIKLCRVLNQTPANELEAALAPLLDIDGALKFLAVENVFINNDGYWTRASDYNLYLDEKGKFHIIPYDSNETFRPAQGPGPGMRGGGGRRPGTGGAVDLDPLAGADDPTKPLLNKLLAAPGLRERYLGFVREIAQKSLDWQKLEPTAKKCQDLIADAVKADTHKLEPYETFARSLTYDGAETVANEAPNGPPAGGPGFGGPGFRGPQASNMSLKTFVVKRRVYLLESSAAKER